MICNLTPGFWTKKLAFCDDKVINAHAVCDVLAGKHGFFPNSMYDIFIERYAKMCGNFDRIATDNDWAQNGLSIEPLSKFSDALLKVPQANWSAGVLPPNTQYTNIGHDMPTWLFYKDFLDIADFEIRPRVMIVAQDPLREGHKLQNTLLLSTPWGFHSLNYQLTRTGQINHRRKMISVIHSYLCTGAIVYLTDFKKLYLDGNKINDCLTQKCIECLKNEIALFKPTHIVTFGEQASRALTGVWLPDQSIPLPQNLLPVNYNKQLMVVEKYHPNTRANTLPVNYSWLINFNSAP